MDKNIWPQEITFSQGKHTWQRYILFIKHWVKSDNEENIKQDKCIDYEESYIVSQKCIFEEMTFKQKLKLKISLEKSSKHKKLLEQRS